MRSPFGSRLCLLFVALLLILLPGNGQAAAILVDFGGGNNQTFFDNEGRAWNNVPDFLATTTLGSVSLVDADSLATSVVLTVTTRFNGLNTNGTTFSSIYPPSATADSLFGNTGTGFNGIEASNPTFVLSGLTIGLGYDLRFYASRIGVGGETRTTDYFVTGTNSGSTSLNVGENLDNVVSVLGITPTDTGEITVRLQASADNNNANKFIYLGVLEVQPVPEPASLSLLAGGLVILGGRRRRREAAPKYLALAP